jgi:hypothetical protein
LKQYLTLKNWFIINAAYIFLAGLLVVLDPKSVFSPAGMILDDIGVHIAREAGALYLGFAILYWFGRNDGPSNTQKGILYGSFVTNLVTFLVVLLSIISELATGLVPLVSLGTGIILTAGWGYFIFNDRSKQPQV